MGKNGIKEQTQTPFWGGTESLRFIFALSYCYSVTKDYFVQQKNENKNACTHRNDSETFFAVLSEMLQLYLAF